MAGISLESYSPFYGNTSPIRGEYTELCVKCCKMFSHIGTKSLELSKHFYLNDTTVRVATF